MYWPSYHQGYSPRFQPNITLGGPQSKSGWQKILLLPLRSMPAGLLSSDTQRLVTTVQSLSLNCLCSDTWHVIISFHLVLHVHSSLMSSHWVCLIVPQYQITLIILIFPHPSIPVWGYLLQERWRSLNMKGILNTINNIQQMKSFSNRRFK
jgi:hypothetical protein